MWRNLINLWKSDNLLQQAWEQSFQMLNITHEMFLEAVRVLREQDDSIIRKEIRDKDKTVNVFQQDVRRKVMTDLAVCGSDMPGGLVLVSIVIDIERIGDYTKNIVELATVYPHRLNGGIYEKNLIKVENAVKDNFVRTKRIIMDSDEDAAMQLLKEYEWVNPECDQRSYDIVQEKDTNLSIGGAATLALYFRWLKRINSHLRNISTSVVNPFDRIGFQPDKKTKDADM